MWQILIIIGMLLCAVMAVRTQRLLVSALWLAGASALVSLWMYILGAPEVAVIELSVGAGLVTVLFVFAINIAGEGIAPPGQRPIAPAGKLGADNCFYRAAGLVQPVWLLSGCQSTGWRIVQG